MARDRLRRRTQRGASVVEYALLLFAVLLAAAVGVKLLGPKVKTTSVIAGQKLS